MAQLCDVIVRCVSRLLVRRAFLVDFGVAVAASVGFEIAISVSTEPGARPLDTAGYVLAALVPAPVLLHRRRPVAALLTVGAFLFAYSATGYPGTSPAIPLLAPVFFAARAGYLRWAVGVPASSMAVRWGRGPLRSAETTEHAAVNDASGEHVEVIQNDAVVAPVAGWKPGGNRRSGRGRRRLHRSDRHALQRLQELPPSTG